MIINPLNTVGYDMLTKTETGERDTMVLLKDWGVNTKEVARIQREQMLHNQFVKRGYIVIHSPEKEEGGYLIRYTLTDRGRECLAALNGSFVWDMLHHRVDILLTDRYWRDQLADLSDQTTNRTHMDRIFSAINKIDHPELKGLVRDAVYKKMTLWGTVSP